MELLAYIDLIKNQFLIAGKPSDAQQKIRYMKNHFDFYGLKAKVWVGILKELSKEQGYYYGKELEEFIYLCFEDEHRELHYSAIWMVERTIKKADASFIETLEWMVVNQSWWDSVDWIAKLVGMHFKRFPDQIIPITSRWIEQDNMWLQRVAIIFQLAYKKETDEALLFKYCRVRSADEDFFIRKAIGWALRQYTRTSPESVIEFVANNKLSALSKREALRLLK